MTDDKKPSSELFSYPLVLCSYKLYDYCLDKYNRRKVVADMHVSYDDFYYWSRAGKQRLCRNKKEIWVLGQEFPEIVRVR